MDFFDETHVSEWTCDNAVEYYKKHISQYGSLKKILYDINIKLKQIVADSDSNSVRGETARYIIDNWKVRFVML